MKKKIKKHMLEICLIGLFLVICGGVGMIAVKKSHKLPAPKSNEIRVFCHYKGNLYNSGKTVVALSSNEKDYLIMETLSGITLFKGLTADGDYFLKASNDKGATGEARTTLSLTTEAGPEVIIDVK